MTQKSVRCLILACGNTLRGDDGVGPWLANWAAKRFRENTDVRVVALMQFTPELAEEVAVAESVLFIDCSVESAPGLVKLVPVEPAEEPPGLATHHVGAAQLLALARTLYNSLPQSAWMLTVGAGSIELGETFSDDVQAALPEACRLLEESVLRMLLNARSSDSPTHPRSA